jgi:glycosyltransferase involved in cell wall biosynthesis
MAAEILAPPRHLRRIRDGVAHIVDHAHSGYLRFIRVPSIVTVHDLIPLKALRGHYPRATAPLVSRHAGLWFRWNLAALSRARLVVAPSRATADDVREHCAKTRVEVVPHGIDAVFSRPPDAAVASRVRQRLGELAGRRIVLQVTNGFFYKNDSAFVRALAEAAGRRGDLAWVRVGAPFAAGDPTPCPRLHYAAASADELAALYGSAALLLFPSWDEGFGWPPLEAMAAGCPVVATDRGALAETAAPAALVVDPGDARAIARACERVLGDAGLASDLVARGRAHAAGYRWADAGRRMRELYAEVARCA